MFNAIKFLDKPHIQQSRPGLQRILPLMKALGNPEQKLQFVHVAGTNGKGSTCAYLAQIFQDAGLKTGLFISPFIFEFNERIQINHKNITPDELNKITYTVKCAADEIFNDSDYPTEFEFYTAIAFLYFAQKKCDIVVCEVGMGGRLDSTNIIPAQNKIVSVIAPISVDHTNYLGADIKSIAAEKAGIIMEGVPTVSAPQTNDVASILKGTCAKKHSSLYFVQESDITNSHIVRTTANVADVEFFRKFNYKGAEYSTRLIANYQPINAAVAIEAARIASLQFSQISPEIILKSAAQTHWPVRFELVRKNPVCVVDGSHNVQGAHNFVQSFLEVFPSKTAILVVGVLADKQYKQMVQELCQITKCAICITPPNERALSANILAKEFIAAGICAHAAESFSHAKSLAFKTYTKNDVICAVGSLYSAAQMYKILTS